MKNIFYSLSLVIIIIGCGDSNDPADDVVPTEFYLYKGLDLLF
ncbi:hypothetical protein [Gelidibacter gilvus]|nr:hypothetical protein [Gelidibacter gilvus]